MEESRLGATLAQLLPESGVSQIPGEGFVLHPKAWFSLSFPVPETGGERASLSLPTPVRSSLGHPAL